MTSKEKALKTFRAPPENHNCAQCIVAGFGREDLLGSMQSCGSGRAPEGICGAIYAAMQIAPKEKRSLLAEKFIERNGSLKCRELKQQFKIPCPQCVATAATCLAEII